MRPRTAVNGMRPVVYVRQSSRQQVLEHSESTRLQYALAGRAVAPGWARSQVTVIDDDLGVSAATTDSRKGFARLVTEVTMGRAGVVPGIALSQTGAGLSSRPDFSPASSADQGIGRGPVTISGSWEAQSSRWAHRR
jgi:hypothetical protein